MLETKQKLSCKIVIFYQNKNYFYIYRLVHLLLFQFISKKLIVLKSSMNYINCYKYHFNCRYNNNKKYQKI